MQRALLVAIALVPALASADPPANMTETLTGLEADLRRAAPDAAARALAGHSFTDAERDLADARELVRRGRADEARADLALLQLRVRLVSLSVDAGRLKAMARDRERRALTAAEEARVARAAFEQAVERRLELEQAPPPFVDAPASRTAAPPPGEGATD